MNGSSIFESFPYGIPSIIGSAITALITVYFIFKGKRRKLVMAVVLFCSSVIVWMSSFAFMSFIPEGPILSVTRILYFTSWFLIPPFYINFALSYRREPRRIFWWTFVASVALALVAEICGFTSVERAFFGYCPRLHYPFSIIANAVYFSIVNAGMILFYREYLTSLNNDSRYQSFLLWAGTTIGFLFAISETIMLIAMVRPSDIPIPTIGAYIDNIALALTCAAVHVIILVMVLLHTSYGSKFFGVLTATPCLLVAGFPVGVVFTFIIIHYGKAVYPFSSVGVLVAIFFIAYAIIKYRLIDITSLLKTLLVYVLLSAAFLLVYATVIFVLYGRSIEVLPSLIIAVTIIFVFNPLQMFLQNAIERVLFRTRYNYQKAIHDVSGRLVTVLDFHKIIDIIRDTITSTIGARSFALILYDHESEIYVPVATGGDVQDNGRIVQPDDPFLNFMRLANNEIFREDLEGDDLNAPDQVGYLALFDRFNASVAIPMTYKGVLSGVLFLGDKESGELYARQDIALLQIMANQAVIALDNARLYELAITDGLTGLFILKYFNQRLNDEVAGAIRNGRNLSLLMLDIDHFKSVNDEHGHQAGDSVLKHISRIIRDQVRTIDTTARYGGEEFAVILPETDNGTAEGVAERIRRAVEHDRFAGGIHRTVSIGIASLDGVSIAAGHDHDPHDSRESRNMLCAMLGARLLRVADDALYRAKREGRNRVSNGGMLITGDRSPGE